MRFTGMLAREARDGAAATHTNWDGDVRSVGDGGWRLGGGLYLRSVHGFLLFIIIFIRFTVHKHDD